MIREVLKYQYGTLLDTWRDGFGAEVRRSAVAFLALTALAFGACMALPDLRENLVGFVFGTLGGLNVSGDDGRLSAAALFSNNVRACTFTMLYGLIPFIRLSALALGMNAMVLGVLAAYYAAGGLSMLGYLAALLPHGLFEFPALVLAFAMGLYVCGQLTRRCRHDQAALGFLDCVLRISRLLLLVLLPLLLAAAVVEAYITPLIASLFF